MRRLHASQSMLRACRVSTSAALIFKFATCRLALSHIVERTLALAGYLAEGGAARTHNVDNLLLRESMDVIGAPALPSESAPWSE